MVRVKHILVPTDFSLFSEYALEYGCELATKLDAELHLLYVVTDVLLMYTAAQSKTPAEQIIREEKEYALGQLDYLPAEAWQKQLTVHRAVEVGVPVTEILKYADAQNIDLIVMGTQGRTGLSHLFLGSVAEKVVRTASCPVLTVRRLEQKPATP